jgi:hypothetical protein
MNYNTKIKQIPDTTNQEQIVIGELIPPLTQDLKRNIGLSRSWRVRVKCFWCGRYHLHGWDPNEPEEERIRTRVSHCFDTDKMPNKPLYSGYTIYTEDEVKKGII